jgi:hypothetical protein
VRALYVSHFAVAILTPASEFPNADPTELNAVVIDVKSDDGLMSYPTQVALAHQIGAAWPQARI